MSTADAGVPAGPSPLDRGRLLPRQDTAAEVAEAVRHLRYPPAGDRGVATYNRACRFALDPGALARSAGGVPFGLQSPTYLAAVERGRAAAGRHGKACRLLVGDGAAAAQRLAEGWSFVAIGSDATLLAATVTTELARARPSTPDIPGGQT